MAGFVSGRSAITATVEEKVRQLSNLAVRATATNLDRMVRAWQHRSVLALAAAWSFGNAEAGTKIRRPYD